ncbi:K(+)-transporting ATPase subunit C [Candidatus Methylacidiphilum fumarolicum]|uniref:Potassium-transporting ATPase KdpC subunit n=2 Tax=Candidatus Methylacidiphilum fumarolicum TaxID=591154 RepID=I0K1F1_METFB|nr:K(+)-transporting ATPase subunit C [Candidatus Methylacidiphilum fumarolicum]MBW6414923.1 K(+)-transporting ATPase subunit C [Candidatus Methylacidiphilum fumarolicum]TFE70383.1 K+-transporting ATPase subunit C [Candidatus Methylacidiphilum fumarolicum]TFE73936.1 K(+)-transporting ATPase subunit C [Candidatus Methylacidiphilum fumarolicum]TFE74443.1 K(+)-transporting ATPase subunit C [Candidatus Methylacidiphilum fumarolicum]TFE77896.1 K+-transporting ATPase subunit C [Candidatus Methylacid
MKPFHSLVLSVKLTLLLLLILSGLYPFTVYILGKLLFPYQSAGSLIIDSQGHVRGSLLIGQNFESPAYFHPRPSASNYDGLSSGGSNLGPSSSDFIETIKKRAISYRKENEIAPSSLIPADAVCASASGLDPHISLKNALLQAPRVAKARKADLKAIENLILKNTQHPLANVFGEESVNVLKLNLELDKEYPLP